MALWLWQGKKISRKSVSKISWKTLFVWKYFSAIAWKEITRKLWYISKNDTDRQSWNSDPIYADAITAEQERIAKEKAAKEKRIAKEKAEAEFIKANDTTGQIAATSFVDIFYGRKGVWSD